MRINTDAEFQSYLDEEIGWRRTELQTLKSDVREASSKPYSPRARATARALSVMAYAHWEGYVKSTFDKLAEIIIKRKPSVERAADEFVISHMKHLFQRLSSGDLQARDDLLKFARGQSDQRLRLRRDELVRTHDNLRFEYFENILVGFGLPAEGFELSRTFVDSQLCDRRNVVAHGKDAVFDSESVIRSADRVIGMIENLRDLQLNLLSGQRYLVSGHAFK
ncbi:MAE_28990/MAE_18760 family HEPN-like nuclease [Brevibacterium sp. 2SA]|uniref:MAE_28990/MAE_18760 family HEPN-like nuclease n=1 Tax=Brevibacterium sp. 2SA TaxID=2502198 RepID=UPI0010F55F7B|nr:MAE_28990/MAE_18760 family HEPN-like nuclease [Brevibacterium sp. 2SA]